LPRRLPQLCKNASPQPKLPRRENYPECLKGVRCGLNVFSYLGAAKVHGDLVESASEIRYELKQLDEVCQKNLNKPNKTTRKVWLPSGIVAY
jgi:hypothetical protein